MPQVEVVPCAALSRSACRLKPAFQAVGVTCALELLAEGKTILTQGGCDVRGAEHRACRLKPAFQAVGVTCALELLAEVKPSLPGVVATCAVRSAARAG